MDFDQSSKFFKMIQIDAVGYQKAEDETKAVDEGYYLLIWSTYRVDQWSKSAQKIILNVTRVVLRAQSAKRRCTFLLAINANLATLRWFLKIKNFWSNFNKNQNDDMIANHRMWIIF